ncbi:MAG: alpha/beta fold hydrolase [Bacteroidetes bacterium]|nr:alpha/beta fold hydrolase [Bacteroidota bacterium]MDA1268222.1 alpha/beta fold hydrolase [Bacteroidota bacterium]
MPSLQSCNFQRPKYLFNGHLETIYPVLFRQVTLCPSEQELVETHDGDVLEVDWHRRGNSKLIVISHGLEGSSSRSYILGMAKEALNNGFDVLAWNYRGCGAQLNRKAIFYHSGATYDLETIVRYASPSYTEISLIGFSLGGNLTLKYLGEKRQLDPKIKKGVAISVPLDLGGSCDKISTSAFGIYTRRFLKSLQLKIEKKSILFPKEFPLEKFASIRTLRDFDNSFTGPLHGFYDAEEYYQTNSSLQFLPSIEVPTLVLNAQNDPFLSQSCYPIQLAKQLEQVHFEFPIHGGHVGFMQSDPSKRVYSETRAVEFICQDS